MEGEWRGMEKRGIDCMLKKGVTGCMEEKKKKKSGGVRKGKAR